ncbi:hypothetical protein jhhlp_005561 [Lomentospora prolificans]|uniref:FAD/NAD(P)-binding domain-containing protein n=1 Tax=Lomentospora prolificans TaxID=41688 RepID=A0A2N3N3G1_9PEZI|nr:hypothetical protein jhhlp_005561 [Lomentospora prolificans]
MGKQVVILGAGPGGIGIAHKLLKRTYPNVSDLKVILVSPSTHVYWPPGTVRGVIPGEFADDILFKPLASAFAKYDAKQFELIEGKATSLDTANNVVQIETRDGGAQTLNYDQLVIATGTRTTTGVPFKLLDSYQETIDKWHDLQSKVDAAKSIVIAGGGPAGVETAGEIAAKYGTSKKITLVNSADTLMNAYLPSVGKASEDALTSLGVKVINKVRATTPFENNGAVTEVTLSNGETIATDLFIPLIGVRPNTEFIPKELHDQSRNDGSLAQDKTLRVSGTQNVWAVGDVGNLESKQLLRIEPQIATLWKNLDASLRGNEPSLTNHKVNTSPAVVATMGRKHGTGQLFGLKLWNWFASMIKGKTLFTDKSPAWINGDTA